MLAELCIMPYAQHLYNSIDKNWSRAVGAVKAVCGSLKSKKSQSQSAFSLATFLLLGNDVFMFQFPWPFHCHMSYNQCSAWFSWLDHIPVTLDLTSTFTYWSSILVSSSYFFLSVLRFCYTCYAPPRCFFFQMAKRLVRVTVWLCSQTTRQT